MECMHSCCITRWSYILPTSTVHLEQSFLQFLDFVTVLFAVSPDLACQAAGMNFETGRIEPIPEGALIDLVNVLLP